MTVKLLALLIIFALNIRACYGKSRKYEKYSLYHVRPISDEQAGLLRSMEYNKYMNLIFWNVPIMDGKRCQILVHSRNKKDFLEKLEHFNIKATVIVEDVQNVFDDQVVKEDAFNPHKNKWEYFMTLEDIYKFLNEIAAKNPEIAKLEVIGKSAEGKDILALSIKQKTKYLNNKIIMEAGAHGHEWLGTTFVLYFIDQLIRDEYEPLKALKFKYNWYFIPILNPDGYVYSQTEDRLWRKNRRIIGKSIGVDLNRNFKYKFGRHDTRSDPDHDHYHGPQEFSEPETQALRDYVERKSDGLMFYFSFHGFGQMFILPYSDSVKHIGNYHEMQTFAKQAIRKMAQFSNQTYNIGIAFELLGKKQSGDSASWVKRTYRVPFVYTILLRDANYYGHALPKTQIIPACSEMKVGLTELLDVTPKYLNLRQTDSGIQLRFNSYLLCSVVVIKFLLN